VPAFLAAARPGVDQTTAMAVVVAAFAATVGGIVVAGPWLTLVVARALGRGGPGSLLAARRLQDNPAAGFRAVSGLILAVFIATVISGSMQSALAPYAPGAAPLASNLIALDMTVWEDGRPGAQGVPPGTTESISTALAGSPGVSRVLELRLAPASMTSGKGAGGHANAALQMVLAHCGDLLAMRLASCPNPAVIVGADASHLGAGLFAGAAGPPPAPISEQAYEALSPAALIVSTDGQASTIERVRTVMNSATPYLDHTADTAADLRAAANPRLINLERLSNIGLLLSLLIAACSLSTAAIGGLIERKRHLGLLRLAGVRLACLARMMLAETVFPLLAITGVSVVLGLGVSAMLIVLAGRNNPPWQLPDPSYWVTLIGGIMVAIAVMAAPMALLKRLTSAEAVRFE
jgi:hypothetical protein